MFKSNMSDGFVSQVTTTRKGYTGHEMLDDNRLTHMNGRVYDPNIGRFLSADILVQAPTNSQSYNRYSYVWNNPLSMVGPSGYEGESYCYDFGVTKEEAKSGKTPSEGTVCSEVDEPEEMEVIHITYRKPKKINYWWLINKWARENDQLMSASSTEQTLNQQDSNSRPPKPYSSAQWVKLPNGKHAWVDQKIAMEIGSRGGHNVALEQCSMFQDCMSKMNSVAFMMGQGLDKTPIKDIEVELPKYGILSIPNPAAEVAVEVFISNFCSSLYASECGATGK